MSKLFYPKLAAQSCIKNGKFYFPYLLTVVGTSAAFYIARALSHGSEMPQRIRYAYLTAYMQMGTIILAIFATVFLFYTNSFLIKRRSKELGLYNILGMGKGNIGLVLVFESLYTWLIGVGGGVLFGMLSQGLLLMISQRLMKLDAVFGYTIYIGDILSTGLIFGIIILLTLLNNLRRLRVQKPVELLHGAKHGEREPKTKWLLTIIGILCLGAGYYLAIMTRDVMTVLLIYFLAVILVIIGTYCLFTAVSITVLKALRKRRSFYYKVGNFIGLSGMIHRMNRNAVGLANICILSTMVLVTVSATLSLYLGSEDILTSRYPAQINAQITYHADDAFDAQKAETALRDAAKAEGVQLESIFSYARVREDFLRDGENYYPVQLAEDGVAGEKTLMYFISAEDYNKFSGRDIRLNPGEVLVSGTDTDMDRIELRFATGDLSYKVVGRDDNFAVDDFIITNAALQYVIVPDYEGLLEISDTFSANAASWGGNITWLCRLDTAAEPEVQIALGEKLSDPSFAGLTGDDMQWSRYFIETREANREETLATNGGFFFLGIFLGLIFMMAMVLIMYYKQISEGYEDKERFKIMQQVGLPKREIRRSINVQVLIVFAAPLLLAGIHVLFDFYLVRELLTLFGMANAGLAAVCTLCSFGVFAAIYAGVYAITAKTYYNIVSEK